MGDSFVVEEERFYDLTTSHATNQLNMLWIMITHFVCVIPVYFLYFKKKYSFVSYGIDLSLYLEIFN